MEKDTKKKKSGLRKAMLPAFAMLLASVLSLTTMTYAWFTQGTDASVDTFQLDVAAGGGLEISTTGNQGTWKSTLTTDDLQTIEAFSTFKSSGKLTPVSTVGEVVEEKIKFFSGTIGSSTEHLLTSTEATEEGYLAFDLYFRNSDATAKDISITGTEFAAVDGASDFAHLATRLAFVNRGSHNANAVDNTDYSANKQAGASPIFEANPEDHTNDGIEDYKANGKVGGHDDFGGTGTITYYGVKGAYTGAGISRYEVGDNGDYLQEVTPKADTETFFTLGATTVTKITVYIWIEGQDADCTNLISSNSLNATLKFHAADHPGD